MTTEFKEKLRKCLKDALELARQNVYEAVPEVKNIDWEVLMRDYRLYLIVRQQRDTDPNEKMRLFGMLVGHEIADVAEYYRQMNVIINSISITNKGTPLYVVSHANSNNYPVATTVIRKQDGCSDFRAYSLEVSEGNNLTRDVSSLATDDEVDELIEKACTESSSSSSNSLLFIARVTELFGIEYTVNLNDWF